MGQQQNALRTSAANPWQGQPQTSQMPSPAPGGKNPKKSAKPGDLTNFTGQLGTDIQNLRGADLSGVQNTARQAARFSPLGGPAGSTLQGIIATGNAVDVSPITQAAQMQG